MYFKKITHGWVEQTFDDDAVCIAQEFFAGDIVEYESENGCPISFEYGPDLYESAYYPFDMRQPTK